MNASGYLAIVAFVAGVVAGLVMVVQRRSSAAILIAVLGTTGLIMLLGFLLFGRWPLP